MTIVIGFGSTEQEFEAAEERAIREHIETRYSELSLDYFTAEFVEEIDKWLKARGKESRAKGDEYKVAADYPSRYSYYWTSVIADASQMVVIMAYHHVNRRHAMSPDGWALLCTEPMFLLKSYDMPSQAELAAS